MNRTLALILVAGSLVAGPLVAVAAAPPHSKDKHGGAAVDLVALKAELVGKYPEQKARIERGVDQVAAQWRAGDGDLGKFVRASYLGDDAIRDTTFARLEYAMEQLDGHFNEIGRELRRPSDLDVGPLVPVDGMLAAFDASAHLTEDLFTSKIAFVVLLNFPLTSLKERLTDGEHYSRRQWAEVRLAGRFPRRVPAEVQQAQSQAAADAELYIAEYNVWMHHLVDAQGARLWPKGLRLISHWNLRDELKADYADPKGPDKQRTILQVMERIVTQTIPLAVIDNPRLDWNPFTNTVAASPAAEVEADAPAGRTATPATAPEPDRRYERLLANYAAAHQADPYSPSVPTAIARSFELSREMPEERVKALLEQLLQSPLVPEVAALISKRLGRKLGPQDLWYNGFVARGKFPEAQLDAETRKRYATAEDFAKDIPRILQALGFTKERAKYLSEHIVVDPSRGAGHALQSNRRGDLPHLRTRVEKDGMNYKGYNIAVHELGHNIEQVFSLYDVDHTLLQGVPNNAFTEALAFVFQARDLELLGVARPDVESERMRVLNDFWAAWEIAGVGLVDIAVWHWMYDHPKASPTELRGAVVKIATDTWNRYYAPVLGQKDVLVLGIYSHMISYPLYVCDYTLGHLIAFQIEEHLKKKKGPIGPEFERIARMGSVTPDLWMKNATGAPVGAEPLLNAAKEALAGAH